MPPTLLVRLPAGQANQAPAPAQHRLSRMWHHHMGHFGKGAALYASSGEEGRGNRAAGPRARPQTANPEPPQHICRWGGSRAGRRGGGRAVGRGRTSCRVGGSAACPCRRECERSLGLAVAGLCAW